MPKSAKYLLIGSIEANCGKSATVLGVAHQLQAKGLDIAYGKLLGTCWSQSPTSPGEEDVRFIAQVLNLPANRLLPTLISLDKATIQKRLQGEDVSDRRHSLPEYVQQVGGDIVLLEGAGTLAEGRLFGLSLPQIAAEIDAAVLLVTRFHSLLLVDALLSAKEKLGDRLIGVLINDIASEQLDAVQTQVQPFLESQGIPVLGLLPRSNLLRSVSVEEIALQLEAEVLCRKDRLGLMVESLTIGAMNVNSALEYFRKGSNMAVVTGGDRADIQLAALETSTQCLILTGHLPPQSFILARAEDLEIPVLSVDLDTLTTVEIIDRAFGQARLHEPIKVHCIRQLMAQHFDTERLMSSMGLKLSLSC